MFNKGTWYIYLPLAGMYVNQTGQPLVEVDKIEVRMPYGQPKVGKLAPKSRGHQQYSGNEITDLIFLFNVKQLSNIYGYLLVTGTQK